MFVPGERSFKKNNQWTVAAVYKGSLTAKKLAKQVAKQMAKQVAKQVSKSIFLLKMF